MAKYSDDDFYMGHVLPPKKRAEHRSRVDPVLDGIASALRCLTSALQSFKDIRYGHPKSQSELNIICDGQINIIEQIIKRNL